jgi:TonB family protein
VIEAWKKIKQTGGRRVPSIFNFVSRSKSSDKKSLPASNSAASKQWTGETISTHGQETLQDLKPPAGATAEFFHTLDDWAGPRRSLWVSAGLHVTTLIVLLLVPLIYTESIKLKYNAILLAPPAPAKKPLEVTTWTMPRSKPAPVPPAISPPAQPRPAEVPKPAEVRQPKIDRVDTAEAVMPAPPKPAIEPRPVPATAPRPAVHTGSFATSAAAELPAKLQPREVQTGGFGDPNGVVARDVANRSANIAPLGSFALPPGAGAGNGTGGARGVRTIVANSGFGNSVGASSGVAGGNRSSEMKLRQSGFGDVQAAPTSPAARKADTGPPDTPAEITFKPKPDYTDDARKQRVEGEVLLRVLFAATGDVRVLEIVRGLGHGLDENAISAAQQIRFKPALRGGRPVDSTVTVHILFQLAF